MATRTSWKRWLWTVASFAICLASCGVETALPDVPITTQPFSTTASSGTLGPWNPQGASTCSITFNTGGGATVTVKGAADSTLSGTYLTNTNFGTSGVITAPSSNSVSTGSIVGFPLGFELTFTGNTGTLAGTVTCSGYGGSTSGGGGGGGTVTQGTAAALSGAWPMYFAPGGIPTSAHLTPLSVAATCLVLSSSPSSASPLTWGVAVLNASSSALTATFTLYNTNNGTCTAATQIWSRVLGAGEFDVIPINVTGWNAGVYYTLSSSTTDNILVSWL